MGSTVQGDCLGYYYYALCTHTCVRVCIKQSHTNFSPRRRAKKAIPRSIERDRRRCIGDDRYCSRYRRVAVAVIVIAVVLNIVLVAVAV